MLVIISYILMILNDSVVLLYGEVRCWSCFGDDMKRVVFLDYIRGVWADLWLDLSTGNLNFDQMVMYIAHG